MSDKPLARKTLEADAHFCAAAGIAARVFRHRLARLLNLKAQHVARAGAATMAWAALLKKLSQHDNWQEVTRSVCITNAVAAAAFTAAILKHSNRAARLLLGVTAAIIAGFAAVQLTALLRPAQQANESQSTSKRMSSIDIESNTEQGSE